MTDKSKRCGTCTEWGWRRDVNKRRSCKVDFGEHMRLWEPGGRPVKEYGPLHVCHRPDDYRAKEESCHIAPDDLASQQCMVPMLSCDRCQAAFPEINSPYAYCPNCGRRNVNAN